MKKEVLFDIAKIYIGVFEIVFGLDMDAEIFDNPIMSVYYDRIILITPIMGTKNKNKYRNLLTGEEYRDGAHNDIAIGDLFLDKAIPLNEQIHIDKKWLTFEEVLGIEEHFDGRYQLFLEKYGYACNGDILPPLEIVKINKPLDYIPKPKDKHHKVAKIYTLKDKIKK